MILVPEEALTRHAPSPLEITDLNGKKMIGIYDSFYGDEYGFLVYKNGEVEDFYIPKKDYNEFNISIAENYISLNENLNFEGSEHKFFLQSEGRYNVKLLGFCESLDEDGDAVCERVFFQIHDRFIEISVLYIDNTCNYVGINEGESPYDFDFYEEDTYNLYTPYDPSNSGKPSLAIVPQKLTGEIFAENEEALACATEYEIMEIATGGNFNGISYGGVDLLADNEVFFGRFYFNYKDFRTVTKEQFFETAFGIKEIESNIER